MIELPRSCPLKASAMIEAVPAAKLPRLSSAERMRRSRERRRKGLRCLTIELREAEIDQFIRRKRLAAEDRDNPDALRWALYEYLDHTLW
jgi:hypothetical protein